MEFFAYAFVVMLMVLVVFNNQITSYYNKIKNLKGLKKALKQGSDGKSFYMAYMGVYQSGEPPYIRAEFKHVSSDKKILYDEEHITFNVSPLAVRKLTCHAGNLSFLSKFHGEIVKITIPLKNIQCIVASMSGLAFEKNQTQP